MTVSKRKPTPDQLKAIYATHGNHSGKGLSLFSVQERKKVSVINPIFVQHTHKKGTTIVASDGNKVHQIVYHRR